MKGRLLAVVALLAPGLASAQVLAWRATEVLRFADAPPDIAFARINDLAVDAEGRFYVLDGLNSEIYVFAPDGQHVRTIGRRGEGPGELSTQVLHVAVAGRLVAVSDLGNQRVSLFGLDGTRQGEFAARMMETGMVIGLGGMPDGTLLIQRDPIPAPPGMPVSPARADRPLLLRVGRDGVVMDTLFRFTPRPLVEFTGSGMRAHYPSGLPAWAILPDGQVAVAETDRYLIRVWSDGRMRDSVARNVARRPMTAAFRERTERRQDSMMSAMAEEGGGPRFSMEMAFPDSFPVMGRIDPGPFGTLLVWRARAIIDEHEDDQALRVDVFSPDRRYLGEWVLPPRFSLMAAHGDRIYGIETDEFDLPYVVVYRVER